METTLIISFINAKKINQTNKDFMVYTLDEKNRINNLHFTNVLHDYYKPGLNHFKVVDDIQKQLKYLTIINRKITL